MAKTQAHFELYFCLLGCVSVLPCLGQSFWNDFLAGNPATGLVYCQFYECCNDDWIVRNTSGLRTELAKRLYGQHLVQRAVLNHVQGHVQSVDPAGPSKALVLSFHGPPGTGKNHVSRIIAEQLYRNGLRSEYVHLVSVPAVFKHQHLVDDYKDQLQKLIEDQVRRCPRSLFIFDEVDKMPRGLIDIIKPYLDYHLNLRQVDYRRATFLLLSNLGDSAITQYMLDQLGEGRQREDILLKEVETILSKEAINSEGLWHSELIGDHLVTAFLPFLPLQREHVRQCVRDALVSKGYYASLQAISPEIVQEVMSELFFYPLEKPLFSVTGCKRVAEKVDYVMQS